MRVGITGYTGELGAAITAGFRDEGHELLLIGRDEPEWQAARDCDVVVHAAGKIENNAHQNVVLATRLAAACVFGNAYVLNLSSVSVYGPTPARFVTESVPCNPVSEYGKSKLEAERAFSALKDRVTHLRIANVFRRSDIQNIGKLSAVLKGNEFSSLVLLEDVVMACLFLSKLAPSERPPAVNVSRSELGPLRFRELAKSNLPAAPAWLPHLIRLARGQCSIIANRLFVNDRLVSLGWKPNPFKP